MKLYLFSYKDLSFLSINFDRDLHCFLIIFQKISKILCKSNIIKEKLVQYVGQPPMKSESSFSVLIADENDETPKFSQEYYYAKLNPLKLENSFLIKVHAADKDEGDNAKIKYIQIINDIE